MKYWQWSIICSFMNCVLNWLSSSYPYNEKREVNKLIGRITEASTKENWEDRKGHE
jgi:hypothetical protein